MNAFSGTGSPELSWTETVQH